MKPVETQNKELVSYNRGYCSPRNLIRFFEEHGPQPQFLINANFQSSQARSAAPVIIARMRNKWIYWPERNKSYTLKVVGEQRIIHIYEQEGKEPTALELKTEIYEK